jgi:peptide/nickel transport system substrate-binding protein
MPRTHLWRGGIATLLVLLCAACGPQAQHLPEGTQTDPSASARFALATGVTRFDPHRATSSYDNT